MPLTDSPPKILLVEDFDDSRAVLKRLLEMEGWQVSEARDGQQAFDAALQDSFDLILMDISLPVVDGLQATSQICSTLGAEAPPIILTSAYSHSEMRAKALAAGAADYLLKPMDFDHLLNVVKRYASR